MHGLNNVTRAALSFFILLAVTIPAIQKADDFFTEGIIICSVYFFITVFLFFFPSIMFPHTSRAGKISLVIAILGNALAGIFCMQFFLVAKGTLMRPMGWAMLEGIIGLLTLLWGMPGALLSLKWDSKRIGITGSILCLTPFVLASLLYNLAELVRGFVSEP